MRVLQRFFLNLLVVVGGLFLAYEGFLYWHAFDKMPPGMTIGGVDVSGLTRDETAVRLQEIFLSPVMLHHQEESVPLDPANVGFTLDFETMLSEAEKARDESHNWMGFLAFVLTRPLTTPPAVELRATYNPDDLQRELTLITSILDKPARNPQLLTGSDVLREGEPGYVTDLEASLPLVEAALFSATNREVNLVVNQQEPTPLSMALLEENIRKQLDAFSGVGSVFILDLQTGEELSINGDIAVSGMSIMKIMILLETYRALDTPPNQNQIDLIEGTMVYSGNYSANLLLDIVAGQDNAYLGVDILTESMHRLGLMNTFIVTPYEEPNRPGITTRVTAANSSGSINTNPDPTMQTTAEDVGTLLSMIYFCAKGKGTLLAVYPDTITPEECQAMIEVMSRNTEGNLIRFGVPDGVIVSHKHGWAGNTHGDAGIVYSEGGDYVLVEYMVQPDSDWLVYEISFPILREISRATYNYFNYEHPYLGNALEEDHRFDEEGDGAGDTAVPTPAPEPTATPLPDTQSQVTP